MSAFVLVVVAAAAAALATLPGGGLTERPLLLLLVGGLAVITGARPVRIPGLKLHMTASHPFMLVALVALGPLAAVLVGLLSVLAAAAGVGRRPAGLRLAFNLGAMALTATGMSWAFLACGGATGRPVESLLFPLAAASAALFAVNTGLVTAAIAIEKREGLFETWRKTFAWNAWTYLMGLTIAVAMLAVIDTAPVWALVVAVAPCWLLILFYRAYGARLGVAEAGRTP